jgi:hypothetical protein
MSKQPDFRRGTVTFSPDFRAFPAEVWGRRDWELVEPRYAAATALNPP